jgi:hypothetical protein
MRTYLILLSAAALGTMAIGPATAATANLEETVQVERNVFGATAEAESADFGASLFKSSETNSIQAAPGFSARSEEFKALLRAPIDQVNPLILPIPPENFIYNNGGVGNAGGLVNRQYFRSCFHENYGILGGSSDRILPSPVTATADSGISPYLDQSAIDRIQSINVKLRYAFNGGNNSTLKLYLTNLTTGKVQFVGVLKSTTGLRSGCANVTQDLRPYIKEQGVYGVRLVMNNRRVPFYLPYAKVGTNSGDTIDLGGDLNGGFGGAVPVDGNATIGGDASKYRPFPSSRPSVAGFNNVMITVNRKVGPTPLPGPGPTPVPYPRPYPIGPAIE